MHGWLRHTSLCNMIETALPLVSPLTDTTECTICSTSIIIFTPAYLYAVFLSNFHLAGYLNGWLTSNKHALSKPTTPPSTHLTDVVPPQKRHQSARSTKQLATVHDEATASQLALEVSLRMILPRQYYGGFYCDSFWCGDVSESEQTIRVSVLMRIHRPASSSSGPWPAVSSRSSYFG